MTSSYLTNELIIQPRVQRQGIYFILSGTLQVRHSSDSDAAVLVYRNSSYIGDLYLLDRTYHRSYM